MSGNPDQGPATAGCADQAPASSLSSTGNTSAREISTDPEEAQPLPLGADPKAPPADSATEPIPLTYWDSLSQVKKCSNPGYMNYAQLGDGRRSALGSLPEATVSIVDVQKNGEVQLPVESKIDANFSAELLKNMGDDIWYRIIIVEDISVQAINILGKEFQLDPDQIIEYLALQVDLRFVRHGVQLGRGGQRRFRQRNAYIGPPQVFVPRQKNYISIQWPRVLIHTEEKETESKETVNIHRPFAFLGKTDSGGFTESIRIAAHYEGASISWSKNNNGSFTVLLLLDPLPKLIPRLVPKDAGRGEGHDKLFKGKVKDAGRGEEHDKLFIKSEVISFDHCRGKWDSMVGENSPPLPTSYKRRNSRIESGVDPNSDITLPSQRSTRQSLQESLPRDIPTPHAPQSADSISQDPLEPDILVAVLLFQIIERDSYVLLAMITHSLQDIHNEMLLKETIEQRLEDWQELFVVYREQILSTRACISNLVNNLETLSARTEHTDPCAQNFTRHAGHRSQIIYDRTISNAAKKFPRLYGQLLCLLEQADSVYLEIQETSTTLMSTMSIIESGRAIEEAEGVSKLTELAFFFIPLGFSASIFGMQVKEFANRISIYTWLATAFGTVLGSYGLRLLVRSRWVKRLKRRLMTRVRSKIAGYPEIGGREPVPLGRFINICAGSLLWACLWLGVTAGICTGLVFGLKKRYAGIAAGLMCVWVICSIWIIFIRVRERSKEEDMPDE